MTDKKIPYTSRRRVLWGDCDPAGIIYTPRVFDYAIETLEEWMLEVLQTNWINLQKQYHLHMPTVKLSCEFMHPMASGEWIDCEVIVKKIGGSSTNYIVNGYNADKKHCFQVDQVSCFASVDDFKPVAISDEFREKIKAYQDACE